MYLPYYSANMQLDEFPYEISFVLMLSYFFMELHFICMNILIGCAVCFFFYWVYLRLDTFILSFLLCSFSSFYLLKSFLIIMWNCPSLTIFYQKLFYQLWLLSCFTVSFFCGAHSQWNFRGHLHVAYEWFIFH